VNTVLVIDDDADMREIERAALVCAGYHVVLATNGIEGLQILERQRPCVILLDLMMPMMDGLTFLAERQRLGLAEDVPVVCFTAGGREMQTHALRLGARECLHKPTDFDDLCERISYYCNVAPT
jgi:two-component system chemotaxis response regulator CheY